MPQAPLEQPLTLLGTFTKLFAAATADFRQVCSSCVVVAGWGACVGGYVYVCERVCVRACVRAWV